MASRPQCVQVGNGEFMSSVCTCGVSRPAARPLKRPSVGLPVSHSMRPYGLWTQTRGLTMCRVHFEIAWDEQNFGKISKALTESLERFFILVGTDKIMSSFADHRRPNKVAALSHKIAALGLGEIRTAVGPWLELCELGIPGCWLFQHMAL